jgi:hypothetical protein
VRQADSRKMAALLLVLPSILFSGFAFAQGRPVFDYPKDGQVLAYEGSYMFKVQPIGKAKTLFSWRISQNGGLVATAMTGNEFGIHPGTPEHSKFVPGRVEVYVSAWEGGTWSSPAVITISVLERNPARPAQPTASSVKPQPVKAAQPTRFRGMRTKRAKFQVSLF